MTRIRIFAFLLALALLHPAPALAYLPASESQPIESVCHDRDELAGVVNAEAGAQLPDVQLRIMQIFVKEAESRGITFCALSHLTRFSGVRYYVRLHPGSYLERQLNNPPEDLLLMADAVLLHQVEDVTAGMGHWDGDGMHILFRP